MPSAKTQQLLDNLKQIRAPKKKQPIIIPITNQYGEDSKGRPIYIDRIYGDIYGKLTLINKNGTTYKGKIKKRSIMKRGADGNKFRSFVRETQDGRWFDNCGMPIEKPKSLVKEEPEEQDSIVVQKTELTAEEKLANEQNFLKGLK